MAAALDGVWAHLDRIVWNARRQARNNGFGSAEKGSPPHR